MTVTEDTATDNGELVEENLAFANEVMASLLQRPARKGEFHLAYDPADHEAFSEQRSDERIAKRKADTKDADQLTRTLAKEATEKLDKMRADLGVISFYFQAITSKEYDALMSEYPATGEQQKEAKEAGANLVVNSETFLPALISRCTYKVTAPAGSMDSISPAQVASLHDANFSAMEIDALGGAVVLVHRAIATVEAAGKD